MKNKQQKIIPIETAHLFELLDKKLIKLLKSLSKEQWNNKSIAKLWCVKDIAAHLLDGNIRTLSISRDGFYGVQSGEINSYGDLLNFLNKLNHEWTDAAKRMSPQLLIALLQNTGKQFCQHIQQLKPFEDAVFAVSWAGQDVSPNWFHIAREYTEKFIHQQQIRDAVGAKPLFSRKLFYPFIDTFLQALPYTFRNVMADEGATVAVIISGDAGGQWGIQKKENGWVFLTKKIKHPSATIIISPETAWKLFSKGITPSQALETVSISGNSQLAMPVLNMVSVMA